jgi:very-short-patch-repair endonuclease
MNTKPYKALNDNEKSIIIRQLYEIEKKSFQDIAILLNTYANKIRRDAIKYKIAIRDKSEAQKNALNNGKVEHPTKGKTRNDAIKNKIGLGVLKSWEQLSPTELDTRKNKARANWDKLSDDEKQLMHSMASDAVRQSSKTGSKLEKFLLHKLLGDGYRVDFHQEQKLLNTRLQIDLFISSMNVAIEVDGPSHFAPVWGDETLQRNIKYDEKKTGLILGKGLRLIRIKQSKDYSKSRSILIYEKLSTILISIQNNTNTDKIITITDE